MARQGGSPLIDLVDIRYAYSGTVVGEDVHVLRGVSLSVDSGEMVCIHGSSGAGKSTLLRIIGCLDRPSEGTYQFGEGDVGELDDDGLAQLRLLGIGFVFQDFQLLDTSTVAQNVELPATCLGTAPEQRRRRARELLKLVGLADKLNRFPAELSGGEQQRVCIARALMNGATAILADEPTGSLDSANADEVLTILEELASRGHAVVVVSHDAAVAGRAHRVVNLADGQVVGGDPAAAQHPVKVRAAPPARRRMLWGPGAFALLFHGLRSGGIRTMLMAFASIVSIFLVIVLMGMSRGAFGGVAHAVGDMGAGRITVSGVAARLIGAPEDGRFEPVQKVELTGGDAALIASRVDNVRTTYPLLSRYLDVRRGDRVLHNVSVIAQTETLLRTVIDMPWPLARGTGLTARDSDELRQVAVVGPGVRERLFTTVEEPIGDFVYVGGYPLEIKGVLGPNPAPKSIFFAGTAASDEAKADIEQQLGTVVYLPLRTAAETVFGTETLDSIIVEVVDAALVEETASEIHDLIVHTHGRPGVGVEVNATLADAYARVSGLSRTALAGVGVVALLGTALIVMSAMLMAVDSRKQEIGLRMAFGARRLEVLLQFAGEAVLVVLLGGAIGAATGFVLGPYLSSLLDLPFAFEPWFAGVAFACSVATGVLAGSFPASRAARVQPATWLGHVKG